MNIRQLKVYESANGRKDPCIMLQGQWLKDIGFQRGDQVEILYEQGCIAVNRIIVAEPAVPTNKKRKTK